jgi:TolB-like protein
MLMCAVANAAPTVAVMPFRDLSGGKGAVGEAIRETVTTDLKDVPGLVTIERGQIDKILAEQNLQASRAELDPQSTVRVGKLLGASLIVTGAYQKAGSSVRLTARFVKVETGEITGTAKVDGAEKDFLQLQDRITVELLRSAGMQKHVERFAKRMRPPIKSLKTVELYGDAVAEPNEEKKVEILKLALNEDPSFEYAARDLDALEKRLKALDRAQKVAVDKKVEELRQQVAAEKDPDKRKALEGQLAVQLLTTRRYFELRKLARGTTLGSDGAAFYVVQTDSLLHDHDAVLHDGEQFLAKFPASPYFSGVKGMMEQAIAKKRKMEEGKTAVVPELDKIEGEQRWNLCRFGWVYRNHEQYKEARRFLRACLEVGTQEPKSVLPSLIQIDFELGDFAQARKDMAELEKAAPSEYRSWKSGYEMQLPADG